mmetsp:Transcript_4187/g.8701  ORF Transcript_4187/g.8701 Transcript_4187/m.8701 type:complete len:262 (-) Transcript_4187:82-867(-)|eukprot:CAMPEP_0168733722 /NCGR_PEP_ID=MMETSP0724-20121128/8441_1 /TAXON_ID=265536 /ORGANISM="Amphiprora sp., Strain CCMP467" /LENGTH=261 /DNA_ID=CAMNT_0008780797 /DNA_START=136 /DNA_END=921 /DNA_ORIENTATION=-
MVPDPYKALNLPHSATSTDIKKSYRVLARQCHPDRLTTASDEEKEEANKTFSKISAAYGLLSDPQRKARYDHIYKYGGYDDENEEGKTDTPQQQQQQQPSPNKTQGSESAPSRKRKSVGVGYSCTDPFAFIWSSGDVMTTKKIAGIQIPSRFQMSHPGAGFQVSVSSGEFRYDGDKRQYTSRTTQFAQGKKVSTMETTTIHNDGRKEVLIQGDNFTEKRTSNVQSMAQHQEDYDLPWYINAWHVVKEKMTMCYNPTVNSVQ